VLLEVPAGANVERPVCVVHLASAEAVPCSWAQRLLVLVGEQAGLTLVEHFPAASGAQNSFVTGATEIVLGAGARLAHQRLHLEEEHALHIGGIFVELLEDARYEGFVLAFGGRLRRIDLELRHRGPGSECALGGVYLARGTQHVDLHTSVEHQLPRGTTRQSYRGIVDGAARAVFNGRILICQDAQKSNAQLSNRNLLLSNSAEVDTKPELEIYADDVQCAHGATVSRMDERSLYYLLSRGIARAEAEELLAFGFINELFAAVEPAPLERMMRARLREWFRAKGEPA